MLFGLQRRWDSNSQKWKVKNLSDCHHLSNWVTTPYREDDRNSKKTKYKQAPDSLGFS